MKKLLVTIAILFAINLNAQTPDRKWGVGLHGGLAQYSGDYGNGFYNPNQAFYGFGGLSLSRNISDHFDIALNASYGDIGHFENLTNTFNHKMFQANFNLKYNFFKYDDVKLRPFVFAGLGYLNFSDNNSDNSFNNMQLPDFGAGLTYKVSPVVSIVLQETFMYSDFDNIDNERGGSNDSYLQHSLGVVFNFGKSKDTDGDGISDRKDACLEVVGLAEFEGCPDTDGDGVADKDDVCPEVAGLAKFGGCADTDGDNIADNVDLCPTVKGLTQFDGCPDTDGDGIVDAEDICPEIAGLVEFGGCADTDGDGVSDDKDACPTVKGLLELKGCPDTDGDGIADAEDACPGIAGIAANKGCPEIKEETKAVFEKALKGIQFESGRDVIKTSSYKILNDVANIMTANPSYKLGINGHTDSQGKDDLNLKLSEKRAQAVKKYLENKGVNSSRLTAKGHGETKPVADNGTRAGRAINRRVEFKVTF